MKKLNILSAILFISFGGAVLFSCTKRNEEPQKNEEPEKGYLTGSVKNYKDEPLSDVKIIMDNAILNGTATGKTDNNGEYRIKIPYGAWTASAFVTKQYHNKEYVLACEPDETSSFTDDGAERNFRWKIAGKIPNVMPAAYYGGSIGIYPAENSIIPDNTYIQLTLTPTGAMVDGSTGEPITLRPGDAKWQEPYEIKDIPIGQYKATVVFKGNEDLPLMVRDCFNNGNFRSEVIIDFEPEKIYRSRTWYKAMVLEFHE